MAAGGAFGPPDRAPGAQRGGAQVSRALSGPSLVFINFSRSCHRLIEWDEFPDLDWIEIR